MLEDMQEWPHFGKEDQACAEATIAEPTHAVACLPAEPDAVKKEKSVSDIKRKQNRKQFPKPSPMLHSPDVNQNRSNKNRQWILLGPR